MKGTLPNFVILEMNRRRLRVQKPFKVRISEDSLMHLLRWFIPASQAVKMLNKVFWAVYSKKAVLVFPLCGGSWYVPICCAKIINEKSKNTR